MKKIVSILMMMVLLISTTGCGASIHASLPEHPIVFREGEFQPEHGDTGFATVEYEDKVFIMYGTIKAKGVLNDISYALGDCLGYVSGDENTRIYALEGASTDVWLVEYYENGVMEEPVVLREISEKGKAVPESVETLGYDYWKGED